MLSHSILIFLRNFKRYKSASFINLFGLSIGLASTLLIYLWVSDELNMDQFGEQDSKRHFQVLVNNHHPTGIETQEWTANPLTAALEKEFPEVDYGIPVIAGSYLEGVLSFDDEHFRVIPQFVGTGYFNVFSCDFVAGDKTTAFSDKNNIVISDKMAMGLFNDVDQAIGKTVFLKNSRLDGAHIVSGVFRSNNEASSRFDVLLTYELFLSAYPGELEWFNEGTLSHVVLNKSVDLDQFNIKIKDFLKTKLEGTKQTLFAQKFSERYLYGKYENGHPVAGRMVYVRVFSLIAFFVLSIACINYVNLSTAQASRRIKEIGVKKAIGAQRKALVYQFFAESIFMTFLSLILAMGIVKLLLPQFNEVTGKRLSVNLASGISLPILVITFLTGLISSIYPALYLSGFKPVIALKGKVGRGSGGHWLHKGLVVFQFAISVVMIISVTVVYQQLNFIQTSNLGYDNEHIISFRKEGKLAEEDEAFISETKKLAGVVNISHLYGRLPGRISARWNLRWEGQEPEEKSSVFHFIQGGHDMAELLGVQVKEGRFLSRDIPTDHAAVVMNEAAIDLIGYEDPIGKKFFTGKMCTIVGVVKNFHFEGLHEEIKPFFFLLNERGNSFMAKTEAENQGETIRKIQDLHDSFNPGYPFEFKFLDEGYQKLYSDEQRIATLSKYFAGVAIAISCLGLLALTAFTTQRRFKEVVIRKVLGSSQRGILTLLSREFTTLVFMALVLGIPVGFYLTKNWLDNFAYRIDLEPQYFVLAGIAVMAIAWVIMMTQLIQSTRVNVTEGLRGE